MTSYYRHLSADIKIKDIKMIQLGIDFITFFIINKKLSLFFFQFDSLPVQSRDNNRFRSPTAISVPTRKIY